MIIAGRSLLANQPINNHSLFIAADPGVDPSVDAKCRCLIGCFGNNRGGRDDREPRDNFIESVYAGVNPTVYSMLSFNLSSRPH